MNRCGLELDRHFGQLRAVILINSSAKAPAQVGFCYTFFPRSSGKARTSVAGSRCYASGLMTDEASLTSGIRSTATLARILVVDDDVDSADIFAELLRMHGHEALVAYNGADALRLALTFVPELAFVDISLVDLSGYELAEAFRVHESLRACRFVAVTGHTTEEHRRASEAAGFFRHLTKPVDFTAVLEAMSGDDQRSSCAPPKGWSKAK